MSVWVVTNLVCAATLNWFSATLSNMHSVQSILKNKAVVSKEWLASFVSASQLVIMV